MLFILFIFLRRGMPILLRFTYLQHGISTKKEVFMPSLWYNILHLYVDKLYIIMELLLPGTNKLRKGFKHIHFYRPVGTVHT